MKLSTNLTLGGKPTHLVDHDIVLDISAGGRASMTIEGTATKGQTLTLDTGYNGELRRWFTGYVYDVQPDANGASKLLCRELAGLLGSKFPVSIQHATLRSLLAWLTDQTQLTFLLPDGWTTPTPRSPTSPAPAPAISCSIMRVALSRYRTSSGINNQMAPFLWAVMHIADGQIRRWRWIRPSRHAKRATPSPWPRSRPCARCHRQRQAGGTGTAQG